MGDPELIDWLKWQRMGPDTAALVAVVDPLPVEPEGKILSKQ